MATENQVASATRKTEAEKLVGKRKSAIGISAVAGTGPMKRSTGRVQ